MSIQEFNDTDVHKKILPNVFSQDELEILSVLRVLIDISRENLPFKEKLLQEDVLSSISRLFVLFPHNCEVLKEATSLLGTLAQDYSLVVHQCIVEKVHLSLLLMLKEMKARVPLLKKIMITMGEYTMGYAVA